MEVLLHLPIFLYLILLDLVYGEFQYDGINCSFSKHDACLEEYALVDESNGLAWDDGYGYLGYENNHYLEASPFEEYVYIGGTRATSAHNRWTDLSSPEFHFDGDGCLGFLYQDNWCDYYAPQRRSFHVLLRPVNGAGGGGAGRNGENSTDILLREYLCSATKSWFNEEIAIVAPLTFTADASADSAYRLVFSGMQHEFSNNIIAVDHVQFTSSRACALQSQASYAPGDCDFEGTDLCGYATDYTWAHEDLRWMTSRREMLAHGRGVGADEAPSGHFLVLVWADAGTFYPGSPNYVGLVSPLITLNADGCLSLTYHNGIDTDRTKNPPSFVLREVGDPARYHPSVGEILHEFSTTVGHRWLRRFIPLRAGTYAVAFEACVTYPYGSDERDVIGVDDVEVHAQSCDRVQPMASACQMIGGGDGGDGRETCHGRGRCVGGAIKSARCQCDFGYFGSRCEFGKTNDDDGSSNNAGLDSRTSSAAKLSSFPQSLAAVWYLVFLFCILNMEHLSGLFRL